MCSKLLIIHFEVIMTLILCRKLDIKSRIIYTCMSYFLGALFKNFGLRGEIVPEFLRKQQFINMLENCDHVLKF